MKSLYNHAFILVLTRGNISCMWHGNGMWGQPWGTKSLIPCKAEDAPILSLNLTSIFRWLQQSRSDALIRWSETCEIGSWGMVSTPADSQPPSSSWSHLSLNSLNTELPYNENTEAVCTGSTRHSVRVWRVHSTRSGVLLWNLHSSLGTRRH